MSLVEALQSAADAYNPDDTTDLIGLALIYVAPALIAAGATIATLVVTVRGQRKGIKRWKGDRKMLDDVHRQTVNDHPDTENMRDQLDRMERRQITMDGTVSEMRARLIDHGHDIRELRGEDRDARAEHDDLVRRLNDFIRREHPGADPL
ncbi:hypothetical protein BA059_02340 [Mycolicibacterium sp. (ex Dasyatis americana)]|nr:hypothetical protein BA059_02340 [Mycolicibacterium sp. (ex Dasyatis americana)]